MDRRTLTMNWDGLGDHDDDDDRFFESYNVSSGSDEGGDDDDDNNSYEDNRMSFVSAVSSASNKYFCQFKPSSSSISSPMLDDYNIWIEEPGSIKDRRRRLLQGMGLTSNKSFASSKINKVTSAKYELSSQNPTPSPAAATATTTTKHVPEPEHTSPIVLVRSRSDGDIESFSINTKRRKEELIGTTPKQRLTRTSSLLLAPSINVSQYANSVRVSPSRARERRSVIHSGALPALFADDQFGTFFLIKSLDTGKEFIVQEFNEDGMWNKLNDIQTGKQLTMEEFEKSVGYSPVVKELMRRQNVSGNCDDGRKVIANNYFSKSLRYSKRRGSALLKNIKGVANSMSGLIVDKEREYHSPKSSKNQSNHWGSSKNSSSQWVKARQHGKSCKEFTALHMCQEIQAHEGSIWTIRFSPDARYLASAGEDTIIHVWEVQECEVASTRLPPDDLNASVSSTPLHPLARNGSYRPPPLAEIMPLPSRKKGKISSRKKGNSIPDYVHVPETVFTLLEIPICSFKGHQDDVLDLSWSRTQLLLSSSMDKTVRLWDMETKSCLKMFAHNDYVTCIQFNPVDDDQFISGSLDAKVRIWSISNRQVVDWTDLNEMVTAASYTPDGQGAIVGSHKGICRFYDTSDGKLEQKDQIELRSRKKKAQPKKITGIQFSPGNPSEALITSADSRLRVLDGSHVIHKFRGLRNTSSQILASFSPDGKYVISPSEDSQVYIWKCEEPRGTRSKSATITTHSHEHFHCRDVSVAIPWPGSIKNAPPIVQVHSKRHSKRSIQQQSLSAGSEEISSMGGYSKRHLPPLPKKNSILERASSCPDEDLAKVSRTDSGMDVGESFSSVSTSSTSTSSSRSYGFSSPSHNMSPSWSWFDGVGHGGHTMQATAWGLAIVTAGLGGELRTYQNFGLPLKVSRQSNLFRDLN